MISISALSCNSTLAVLSLIDEQAYCILRPVLSLSCSPVYQHLSLLNWSCVNVYDVYATPVCACHLPCNCLIIPRVFSLW